MYAKLRIAHIMLRSLYSYFSEKGSVYHHLSCEECGEKGGGVLISIILPESFIYLSGSGSGSVSVSVSGLRCRIPDSGFVLFHTPDFMYGFLVSKETAVLRRWERLKQQFGFIKRVDKG